MPQTVKQMLFDAVEYDEPFTAHAVYYAVQKGLVTLDDMVERIPFDALDYEIIKGMREDNVLAMCNIKLFAVRIEPGRFAFYLAENKDDAQAEHSRLYGNLTLSITDMTEKMDTPIYCSNTGRVETFREIKKRTMKFPFFTGEMTKR